MKRTTVGLVQINSSFSGQNYFPYSAGVLQAYAQEHLADPEQFAFLVPIYRRIPIRAAIEHLRAADVAGFSAYVWNFNVSLAIARGVKLRRPDTLVVFGGPQVPRRDRPWEVEAFLRENPFVDLAMHGAGEEPFRRVLQGFTGDWRDLPSVSFMADGTLVQTTMQPGFKDLAEVPSPYVSGTFDALMAANPDQKWIGLWETNRNCPFSCTFCGWGLLESKLATWPIEHVYRDVDWFADHRIQFVFCADANFGLLPRDLQIAQYVAKVKHERGWPQFLSVQDTKNVKERAYAVRVALAEAVLNTGVVISLQSIDPATLKIIRRDNIKLGDFLEIQRRFWERGIETMTDIILGLPGETYESFTKGVSEIIASGQHHRIQFNILVSVPDAELSHRDYMAKYGLQTVRTKMVNIHGYIESDEAPETQDLIIATDTMPAEDWVRARAFAWMTGFLHFDKMFQIPLVLAHELADIPYKDLIELFSEGRFGNPGVYPTLHRLRTFFLEKARDIQRGGSEYCHKVEYLDIWWPADEFMFIELAVSGEIDRFFEEATAALAAFVEKRHPGLDPGILADASLLNRRLVKRPFVAADDEVKLGWNIREVYRAAVRREIVPLTPGAYRYRIDRTSEQWTSWTDWCREVVWYGNKRGAYLYGNAPVEQLPGHY